MRKRLVISFLAFIVLLLGSIFADDSYAQTSVFGPLKYVRETGKPQKIIKTFSVHNPNREFTLNIQNGEGKKGKVSSAVIRLNGVQVVAPNEFNKQVNLITKSINLQEENEIVVELRGEPGTWFIVTIFGPPHEASGTVNDSGGTIEVTDPNSPIRGAKVIVPQGALDTSETVTIEIDYEDILPGPIESGVIPVSKVIVLTKDSSYNFKQPVKVVVPYSDVQMEFGDIPAVFYWDITYSKYIAVGVKEIDVINKTITFSTVHFTKFVALTVKGLAKSLFSVDTGFRTETDGFFHPNFGAYDAPGGSCLGMANYSVWYFDNKKTVDGSGLYSKYRQDDPSEWQDDTNARELISRAFIASSQIWANLWYLTDYVLGDDKTGLLLITTMKITKAPQTFLFRGDNFGHAVTVYKYDIDTGKFYIYDNNFPSEEVTVDWNPVTGFSHYSKEAAYPQISKFGFEAFSSVAEAKDFENLYEGAESGWSSSKFTTINVALPALDTDDTATVQDPNNVAVTGSLTGGIKTPKYLVYYLNGGSKNIITLSTAGSYSLTISSLPNATNSLMMIATDDDRNEWNAYAGFKEITIKVKGQTFFTNLGFETGDFTGWNHETHTWQNATPGSFTPEKSGIETTSYDPIDTTIQKVYKGNYSARVNNYDNYYHISSVSQTATVPNVVNPQLQFYWAAVLEDPQHDAPHQPYVDILVIDETIGTVLYSKHHYSNDPSYSGWLSVFNNTTYSWWRTIPWQVVFIDVSNAKGHQITLRVLAADCGYGGHGGYVYLDGDE